jgi:hypothetical protein
MYNQKTGNVRFFGYLARLHRQNANIKIKSFIETVANLFFSLFFSLFKPKVFWQRIVLSKFLNGAKKYEQNLSSNSFLASILALFDHGDYYYSLFSRLSL